MCEENTDIKGNGSKLRENEIPDDWDLPIVGDVSIINDSIKKEQDEVSYLPMDALNTELPWADYISSRNPNEHSGRLFKEKDTLVAKITPCTENGKSAYIDKIDSDFGIATTEVITLTPKNVNPIYLYYYTESHPSKNYIVSRMRGTSGRQRVPKSVFESELKIPLPNSKEQERIASVLYSVDKKLEQLHARKEKHEQLKQGLMQDLLTGEKRIPRKLNVNTDVTSKPHNFERNNKLNFDKLGNHFEMIKGKKPNNISESGKYKYLVMDTLKEKSLTYTNDTDNTVKLNKDELLFVVDGSVGKVFTDVEGVVASTMAKIKPKNTINKHYLYYLFKHNYNLISTATIGSAVPHADKTLVRSLKVFLPTLWEQERIASVLYTVDKLISKTDELIDKYEELKRGLMQDLISGDIRTSEDLEVLESISE